ncbi:MAG: MBL fold metallo-hydrolase, partial [Rivularia sp. (in: cyanobacteria)]
LYAIESSAALVQFAAPTSECALFFLHIMFFYCIFSILSTEEPQLIAFRNFCWYSWDELQKSMPKLTNYSFEWVLPGHGRRYHGDVKKMQQELTKCIDWMKTV